MTTYTLQGILVTADSSDTIISVAPTSVSIALPSDGSQSFEYTADPITDPDEVLPTVDITGPSNARVTLEGIDEELTTVSLGNVEFDGKTTTVLAFTYLPPGTGNALDWYFVVGGAALPSITTPAEFEAFNDIITGGGPVTTGPLAPGADVAFSGLSDIVITPGEVLIGGTGDDTLTGTNGDDYIEGGTGGDSLLGGSGNDTLLGGSGNDTILGLGGDDTLIGDAGDDSIDGGAGFDRAEFREILRADATITEISPGVVQVVTALGSDTITNVEELRFDDITLNTSDLFPVPGVIVGSGVADTLSGGTDAETLISGGGDDRIEGGGGDDSIDGGTGDDKLFGGEGDDSIVGGDGHDTLNGGVGDDELIGGSSSGDLRDVIFGGDGHDLLIGGYGNDLIYGMDGNDTIVGGFGADDLQGQNGDDVITGSALSDLIYGGAGSDFVNGGFGYDRINGGTGADKFYHLGIFDHGSDWIQDYTAAEGDVLVFGNTGSEADDFQVNFAHTANAEGVRSGEDDVAEGFVIYRPTGQIIWALVDGAGQDEINLKIGAEVFDLLV